jgi:hypothetical protein
MHAAYYENEVRDFEQIPKGDSARVRAEELKLSQGLIERLSVDEFKADQFEDEYRLRVLGMLKEKRKGEKITIAPEPERNGPQPPLILCKPSSAAWRDSPRRKSRREANRQPHGRGGRGLRKTSPLQWLFTRQVSEPEIKTIDSPIRRTPAMAHAAFRLLSVTVNVRLPGSNPAFVPKSIRNCSTPVGCPP